MEQITPGSAAFKYHVRQLVGNVDWTRENPLLVAEGVKGSIEVVFPWFSHLSDIECHQLPQIYSKLYHVCSIAIDLQDFPDVYQSLIGCQWIQELIITSTLLTSGTNLPVQSVLKDIGSLYWLTNLDVSDNHLISLPQSLYQCKQLEIFDLSGNQLHSLHEDIGCMSRLKEFYIHNNKLADLPQSLYQCKQLEVLSMGGNQLHSLSGDIGCLSCLKELYIHVNNLTDLPQSLYQCKQLVKLYAYSNQLHSMHQDIGCLSCLKELYIFENKLTDVPQSLYQCKQLEILDVSGNQLHSLHEDIGCLSCLKQLHVRENKLTDLPQSLYQCKQLEMLGVGGNQLQFLHEDIGFLSCLKQLGIYENKLTDLPQSLYQCKQLEKLSVRGNQLHSLHEDIGCLSSLKHLYIYKNQLTDLPQSLYQCKQLEKLYIYGNQLHSLHTDIGCLRCLKELYIHQNKLTDLPQSLYQCEQLEILGVSGNQIHSLHEDIGRLICLKELYIYQNKLEDLPQSLYKCNQLKKICTYGNKLHSLHQDIGCLNCLKEIYIYENKLTDFPQSLYHCKQLEQLHVSYNELYSLQEDIGFLSCLKELHANGCNLTSLPQSLYQCKQLEILSVHSNQLDSLHEDIGCLSCLEYLNVDYNKLTSLPQSLYQCKQLQRITSSNNQLHYIQKEIGELACLSRLNVSHNNIKSLPLEILRCTELKELKVYNNNLNIPNAVLHSDVKAIFNYLQEIRHKGSTRNARRNIMFLGNTLAGKTSLLKTLLSGKAHLTNVIDRTHGMEKHEWLKKAANKPYPYLNIGVSDFGGHACYNITTVFFWNESSLFLVIFSLHTYDPSKYRQMVGQWMEMIAEAIPKAVIILVGTHKDKCTDTETKQIMKGVLDRCNKEESMKQEQIKSKLKQVKGKLVHCKHSKCDVTCHKQKHDLLQRRLEEMLRQRPYIIQEIFAVSSKTVEGIEAAENKVLSILEDETLFPTKVIPLTWHHLRDLLSAQSNRQGSIPWLSWDTLKQLAMKAKLTDNKESITEALSYLKLSNDILWYEDNDILKNIVFNQPNELIGIFKALISHDLNQHLSNTDPRFSEFTTAKLSQVREELVSKGKLTKDILKCIWKNYTPDEASFELLVMLMVKFDFGYILPRQDNCVDMSKFEEVRIPWFLRDDEPAAIDQQWPKYIPTEEQQIAIKVEFRRWAPPTLLPSLCVRIQRHISQSTEWKNGLLATTTHGNTLLLKLVTENKNEENENEAVLVYVRGENLLNMWQVLLLMQQEMDALLDTWPGVIFNRVVPCPGCAKMKLANPKLHSDRWLYEVCSDREILCNNCVDTAGPMKAEMVYPPPEVLQTLRTQYLQEDCNFLRYQKLVIEYGSKMPRQILEQHLSPQTLQEWLQENEDVFRQRLRGRDKWIYRLLYPESSSVQLADLDMTTLTCVFTKLLDDFPAPRNPNGWFGELDQSDLTQAADLLRLSKLRNNLAHSTKCQLSDEQFEERWDEAEAIIVRLGGSDLDISIIKHARLPRSS